MVLEQHTLLYHWSMYFFRRATIISKQLCAGGTGGRDSCGGDSGGPLKIPGNYRGQTRVIQHGVVSFGPVK